MRVATGPQHPSRNPTPPQAHAPRPGPGAPGSAGGRPGGRPSASRGAPAGTPSPGPGTGSVGGPGRDAASRWLELRLPSLPENVGIARVAVAAFAGQLPFTLSELEEIKVAVSEAVTNAIVHGYGDGGGVVTVRAEHNGTWLRVEVADSGRGIEDIDRARQPAFSTDPDRMGMGFAFMEAFMDQVEVESAPGCGTTVRMFKRPRPQERAGGDRLEAPGAEGGPAAARQEAAAGLGDAPRAAGIPPRQ